MSSLRRSSNLLAISRSARVHLKKTPTEVEEIGGYVDKKQDNVDATVGKIASCERDDGAKHANQRCS